MNFRPAILFALSLIVGILLATFVFVTENLKLVFLIFFILCFVCFVVLVAIFKKKFLAMIAVCILLCTVPIGQIYSRVKQYNNLTNYSTEKILINGRISSNYKLTSGGSLNLVIDNILLVGPDYKLKIDGKVSIYTNPNNFDLSKLEVGRYVSVLGKLELNNIEDIDDYTLFNLSNNVIASSYVYYSDFNLKGETKLSFDEKVRGNVYEKLESFDINYADVGYAMMFGDSSTIDLDVVSAFRTTGIAHLLAVSGLHVSIIAMVISFVLKRFKLSNFANFASMAILLLFYSYLCDFSVSVVRASLMMLMFLYLKARGKCYDRLTALALSICVILLSNPLNLFNVSFILSYMAVYSIIVLTKTFEILFDKCFHKKLSGTLALIFAVQVGLIFIQLYFFKKYSPLSIICNFISIPVATIAFVILIIVTIISFVMPFMSFVAIGYDYLMSLVVKFNYTISKIGLVVAVNNLNFLIVIFGMILMLLFSHYVFMKKRYRAVGISIFMVLSTILMIV